MSELTDLLERQERWQRSRAQLTWSEKLRLAEVLRDAALAIGRERKEPGRLPTTPNSQSRGSTGR